MPPFRGDLEPRGTGDRAGPEQQPAAVQPDDSSPLGLELFHYVQKIIVDLRLVAKLQFHLVQVRQSIFHLKQEREKA